MASQQIQECYMLQELQSHSVKTPDCWTEMIGQVLERKV